VAQVDGPPLRLSRGGNQCSPRPDFPTVIADLIVPTFTRKGGPAPLSGGKLCNDIDALGPRNRAYLIISECIHHTP
jgi:hypothetical protein